MEIIIRLFPENLRKLCIDNDYYTKGSNTDYDNLFALIKSYSEEVDAAAISIITTDIYNHSVTDDNFETVANKVLGACMIYIDTLS
jgi:hypothetical protein